jgi:hypothetical protein
VLAQHFVVQFLQVGPIMKVHTLLAVHLLSAVMKPQCRAACWPRSFHAPLADGKIF